MDSRVTNRLWSGFGTFLEAEDRLVEIYYCNSLIYDPYSLIYDPYTTVVYGEWRATCLEAEDSLVERVHFHLPSVDRVGVVYERMRVVYRSYMSESGSYVCRI